MNDVLTFTVKQESDARWSAKFVAIKAVHFGIDELVDLLETMSANTKETSETSGDAQSLLLNVVKLNFITLLAIWYDLLSKINRVQNRLQDPAMSFHEASRDLRALKQVLSKIGTACAKTLWSAEKKNAGCGECKSKIESGEERKWMENNYEMKFLLQKWNARG